MILSLFLLAVLVAGILAVAADDWVKGYCADVDRAIDSIARDFHSLPVMQPRRRKV